MIRVNGVDLNIAGKTLYEFLEEGNYDRTRVAVEKNGDIVPRKDYESTRLQDGDSVEIVHFVGGG